MNNAKLYSDAWVSKLKIKYLAKVIRFPYPQIIIIMVAIHFLLTLALEVKETHM